MNYRKRRYAKRAARTGQDKINLDELTYLELKAMCKENGLSQGGKKAVLLERLTAHFAHL